MTSTQAMPAVATALFDPSIVWDVTKAQWCKAQEQTCPEICYGSASTNLCITNDLSWVCLCSNGTVPDVTAFISTLPFYICQETFSQCMANNTNNEQGQQQCSLNEQCGMRNATAEYVAQQSHSEGTSTTTATISVTASTSSPFTTSSHTSSFSDTTSFSSSTSSATSSSATSSPAPTAMISDTSNSGMSTTALVGIAVGSAVAGILLTAFAFLLYRRHRKRRQRRHLREEAKSLEAPVVPGPLQQDDQSVAELPGNTGSRQARGKGGTALKSELVTDHDRHELDNTDISGTLNAPWSETVQRRYELGGRDTVPQSQEPAGVARGETVS